MEVADQVAVMSQGRIEQIGSPRDVYEHPANEFVMTFVGQAHRLGETFVRPHDLEVTLEPNGSTREYARSCGSGSAACTTRRTRRR